MLSVGATTAKHYPRRGERYLEAPPDPIASGAVLLAQTTTTEVRRIVGDPLPTGVVVGAGLALLVLILIAGLLVRRRSSRSD
jgi:hypothetical protein